jgi:hypothetical protein
MTNSVVNLDELFSAPDLRAVLEEVLCVSSVLPCFMHGTLGSSAHCILPIKKGEEQLYTSTWIDHILCKVLKIVPSRDLDGSKANVNVSSLKVAKRKPQCMSV